MELSNFFCFVLIFINIGVIISWKCGTDQLKLKPKPINLKKPNITKVSISPATDSEGYSPIIIGYDFSTFKKPNSMSQSTFENVKSLLKDTRVEFSKFLKVRHKSFDLSGLKDTIMDVCELTALGRDYPNFLIDNDVIIFPMFEQMQSTTIASAAPCLIQSSTNKPLGGILLINNQINFEKTNFKLYMKQILLHEITHILAFHPYFFATKGMNYTNARTNSHYIVSQTVIRKAREHFNCYSLTSLKLENQGGEGSAGSHWESRYMLADYMVSTDFEDTAISDMTLALFEDTGFYKVNYFSGGLFKFGKNKGCAFFSEKCMKNGKATFEEFCDVRGEPKCTSSRSIKSSCFIVQYQSDIEADYRYFSDRRTGGFYSADYCPVAHEYVDANDYFPKHCNYGNSNNLGKYEQMGDNSLCFISSLVPTSDTNTGVNKKAVCYEVECNSFDKQLIVKVGSQRIICPQNGGEYAPSGFKGSIECPKYDDLCNTNDDTVCNEMFDCLTKEAEKNNYYYKVDYYDYSGNYFSDDDDDDDDDDGYYIPTKGSGDKFTTNFILLVFFLLLNIY